MVEQQRFQCLIACIFKFADLLITQYHPTGTFSQKRHIYWYGNIIFSGKRWVEKIMLSAKVLLEVFFTSSSLSFSFVNNYITCGWSFFLDFKNDQHNNQKHVFFCLNGWNAYWLYIPLQITSTSSPFWSDVCVLHMSVGLVNSKKLHELHATG